MTQELQPDEKLIAQALTGDAGAFEVLVRRYQDFIVNFLYRQTRDREAALEQAQETFIKAYRSLGSFRGGSAFRTWLASIAINSARSELKKENRRKQQIPSDTASHDSMDPERALDQNRKIAKLRSIVGSLKAEYREVIELCAIEGFSYQEAAVSLNVPLGTVCSRMNAALKEVRFLFSKEVEHE